MGAADPVPPPDLDDALVREVLEEYGELTRRHLRDVLPRGDPASYLYDLLGEYPKRGGKLMRPSLCLATARAFGASPEKAIASAVSIELLHNALLIHDDIEDASDERRGSPTLHAQYGMPLALNAGDALSLLCLRPLKSNYTTLGPSLALRIFEETERTAWETAEGQALELGWRRDNRADLDDEDYLVMVLKKTCWLATIHPMRVGALIGARHAAPLDPLIRLGFFFGAAFQIQDDLLNLQGGAAYGKETNGDLLEGKRTLMVIHALREAQAEPRRRLLRYLGLPRPEREDHETEWISSLLTRTGSLEHARQVAKGLAGAALYEFEQIFGHLDDSRDLRFIRAMITWAQSRAH
ncbi:polyprenyl synthetase family protein [Variovorax saccharolyticus]|uniref:polyprenyl synthetase family protein n=1 Tax=Variovorax saccharolyticus TaxID=3053516 RepID=UPI0025784CCF|nr:polyprenyl synthetase family protein [Variovorax sp. J31P216]MDM0026344.1 polyprenyl synthetase family protein [Variovorax sp. J31P216]